MAGVFHCVNAAVRATHTCWQCCTSMASISACWYALAAPRLPTNTFTASSEANSSTAACAHACMHVGAVWGTVALQQVVGMHGAVSDAVLGHLRPQVVIQDDLRLLDQAHSLQLHAWQHAMLSALFDRAFIRVIAGTVRSQRTVR